MFWRVIVGMWLLIPLNVCAATDFNFSGVSYRQFIGCYFHGNHEFTQQLNTVIKQQVRLGNGVIFDEPVVIGFSSRKPSNHGFYVDYEQSECTPNFETMQSTCKIEVTGFKYGSVPSIYKRIYLDTLRTQLDATSLDEFVAALVQGLGANARGVEIAGLGIFAYDPKKAVVVFEPIPLDQLDVPVAAPAPLTALECNIDKVVDLSVTKAGLGSVVVTSNNQLFSQSVVNGVEHYYYPDHSQITLLATPAAGYHFVDFQCTGTDTGSSNSTLNPATFNSTTSVMRCDAFFMQDAPTVATIGNSQTSVRLISATGKWIPSPNFTAVSYRAGLIFYLDKYSSPHKLDVRLEISYCWKLDTWDPSVCGSSFSSGVFEKSFSERVRNISLGTEYTLSVNGVTAKFVADGWANDNSQYIDLKYLGMSE